MPTQSQLIDGLIADANAITQQVAAWRRDRTDEQLTTRPAEGAWSVAECIDHLRITGGTYYGLIRDRLDRNDRPPRGDYRPGAFARWFIRTAGPTSGKKVKAPKAFSPEPGQATADALDQFVAQQAELVGLLEKARAVDLNGKKFGSPITRLIRFTAGEALELMVRHQQRHLDQARRALPH